MADDKTLRIWWFIVPARPGGAGDIAAGVPAQPGDHRIDMLAVSVDGDPATRPGSAPSRERAGCQRSFEQIAAVQRVADRPRAVIASIPPTGVPTAPDVGGAASPVRGCGYLLDHRRRTRRRDRLSPARVEMVTSPVGASFVTASGLGEKPPGDAWAAALKTQGIAPGPRARARCQGDAVDYVKVRRSPPLSPSWLGCSVSPPLHRARVSTAEVCHFEAQTTPFPVSGLVEWM
jgi:hypothetical protein